MSNAARKERKRKHEKFEKAAKVPTYSVGLPRPKHSATPYQLAKAVDRALAAVRKPVQDRLADGDQFKDPCPTCRARGDEPCMTRAGKVASKPHAGR